MSSDVLVRLRLKADELKADVDRALAPLNEAAGEAGRSVGSAFSREFVASSRQIQSAAGPLRESLGAQEAALARLRPLAIQYAAAQADLKAELDRLRVALKAGEISQTEFNLAQIEGRTALKAHAIEMRQAEAAYLQMGRSQQTVNEVNSQARAGMQQLSYQLGDVATMYAMGAQPMQIFVSQSGQVLQAVQMMTGGTSRLATFLSGPWGLAITGAAVALTPFIARLLDTEDAADGARSALEEFSQARQNAVAEQTALVRGEMELNELLADRSRLQREIAQASGGRTNPDGTPMFAYRLSQELAEVEAQIQDAQQSLFYATVQNNQRRQQEREQREREREAQLASANRANRHTPGAGRPSDADRAQAQAIREARQAEDEFERSIQRTLEAQSESVRLEEIRKQQGDAATAAEQARLAFVRENPLAVHQTVEALTAALGITRQLTTEERAHYENLIASADAAEKGAIATARRAAEEREFQARKREEAEQQEKIQRDLKASVDAMYEDQEAAVRDLADLYEGLFTGGNGRIWKDFKQQGLRMVADVAAQWTLALLSGQSGGAGLSPFGKGAGANPLATIFNLGGLMGGDATGKPGAAPAGGVAGTIGGLGSLLGVGGSQAGGTAINPIASAIAAVPGLNVAIAAAAVTHVVGEGLEKLTGLRFDALGGLFGGVIGGFAVGALKGAVKGNATIGADGSQLGIVDSFGKRKFQDQAISDATGIMDTLAQIASGLGTDLNASLAAVSIGTRNGKYRVDPAGQGALRQGKGAIDFGKDQEAAVAFAIRNLIEDGVLGPISEASRKILTAGGDLQQAIEKAVLIESVPKLLKQRLDPLGAQLEEIDEQFRKLAEAMKEGGASAEQIAEARQLWQLERDDAIKQIGQASASLKDFLQALTVGSGSPLSLRQQRAEAEKILNPYVSSIEQARTAQAEVDRLKASGGSPADIAAAEAAARAAAGKIDQGGFQNAAQSLLGISRQINGSGAGFFADFDRIRALTGGAIGAIDGAASLPGAGQDPFTQATAQNTGSMVDRMDQLLAMTAETNMLLLARNDNSVGTVIPNNAWLKQNRKLFRGE